MWLNGLAGEPLPVQWLTPLISVTSAVGWGIAHGSLSRADHCVYNEDGRKLLSVSSGASILRLTRIRLESKRLTTKETLGVWIFRYLAIFLKCQLPLGVQNTNLFP
jgi:hypothetical protein